MLDEVKDKGATINGVDREQSRKKIKDNLDNATCIFNLPSENLEGKLKSNEMYLAKECKDKPWFIAKIIDRQLKRDFKEQEYNVCESWSGKLIREKNKFVNEYVNVKQKDGSFIEIPRYLYHGTLNDFKSNNIQISSKDDVIWFSFDINISSNYSRDRHSNEQKGVIHKYDLADKSFPFELENILIVDNLRGNTPFKEMDMLVQKSKEGYNFVLDKNTGDMIYIGHLKSK